LLVQPIFSIYSLSDLSIAQCSHSHSHTDTYSYKLPEQYLRRSAEETAMFASPATHAFLRSPQKSFGSEGTAGDIGEDVWGELRYVHTCKT
jgi:hypothetical protein